MSPTMLIVTVIAGSALASASMLVVFGLFLRSHFTRLVRDAERRIFLQLNGEDGLRAKVEKLERGNSRLLEAREELRRQGKDLERQKRATFALTQIARGLTQSSSQNLERVRELERRSGGSRAEKP